MKRFVFEASKAQLEKPTEPKYVFCTTAKAAVYAETEAEARALAEKKLASEFFGAGTGLYDLRLVKTADLPVDWNYGYGDGRRPGDSDAMAELVSQSVIR